MQHHVFVETNWGFDYAGPAYLQKPAAVSLMEKAVAGEIYLHLPAICLTEARRAIQSKPPPRTSANSVRQYLAWARTQGKLSTQDDETVRRVLDQYESQFASELKQLAERLARLREQPGFDLFPLGNSMLARAVDLSLENLDLEPFDQAILAAVLVRADELRSSGADTLSFCELDSHLQPWGGKQGEPKQPLTDLYDAAHVWVYGDFSMENPPRPSDFPWN
jgi:hypothetical protein